MKLIAILFFLLLFSFLVSAKCDSGQININIASLEELDQISGIGPAKAQAIIDARPYSILNDLIKAKGIGETTLENIKFQGLACVIEEIYEEPSEKIPSENFTSEETNKIPPSEESLINSIKKGEQKVYSEPDSNNKIEPIYLNYVTPKDIKTEENSKNKNEKDYAWYALGIFCVFMVLLFVFDKKKKNKNEFRNN